MDDRYACQCCGYLTLPGPSQTHEICKVCGWQDDFADDSDTGTGGGNGGSLSRARVNFKCLGYSQAAARDMVRDPKPEEIPPA